MVRQKHLIRISEDISSCAIDLIGHSLQVDNYGTREVLAVDCPPRRPTYMLKRAALGWVFVGEGVTIIRNMTYVVVNNKYTAP